MSARGGGRSRFDRGRWVPRALFSSVTLLVVLVGPRTAKADDVVGADDALDATERPADMEAGAGCVPEACAATCGGAESTCVRGFCVCYERLECGDGPGCPDDGRCTCALAGALPRLSGRAALPLLIVLGLLWRRGRPRAPSKCRRAVQRRTSIRLPLLLAAGLLLLPRAARAQDDGETEARDAVEEDSDREAVDADGEEADDVLAEGGESEATELDVPGDVVDGAATCEEVCREACGGGFGECRADVCHCRDHFECPDLRECRVPACCGIAVPGGDVTFPVAPVLVVGLLLRRRKRAGLNRVAD